MTPDEILSYPAHVLTQGQREAYFDNGFVNVGEIVSKTRNSVALKELGGGKFSGSIRSREYSLD